MFQNSVLDYNIRVKSKLAELYYLKKDEFIKLSISYRNEIESFLNVSIVNYFNFVENKNRLEDIQRKNQIQRSVSLNNYSNKDSQPEENRNLTEQSLASEYHAQNFESRNNMIYNHKLDRIENILKENPQIFKEFSEEFIESLDKLRNNINDEEEAKKCIYSIKELMRLNIS